jgi:hypothetical protein
MLKKAIQHRRVSRENLAREYLVIEVVFMLNPKDFKKATAMLSCCFLFGISVWFLLGKFYESVVSAVSAGGVSVSEVDFGDVALGATSSSILTIFNQGLVPVSFSIQADCTCLRSNVYEGTVLPRQSFPVELFLTAVRNQSDAVSSPTVSVLTRGSDGEQIFERLPKFSVREVFEAADLASVSIAKPYSTQRWEKIIPCSGEVQSAKIIFSCSGLSNLTVECCEVSGKQMICLGGELITTEPGLSFDSLLLEVAMKSNAKLVTSIPVVVETLPIVEFMPKSLAIFDSRLKFDLSVNEQCKDWTIESVEMESTEIVDEFNCDSITNEKFTVTGLVMPNGGRSGFLRGVLWCRRKSDADNSRALFSIPWVSLMD